MRNVQRIRHSFLCAVITMACFSSLANANSELPAKGFVNILSKIPFSQGADICRFQDGYGQSRDQFVSAMTRKASRLMDANMTGSQALNALWAFNSMYDQIQYNAIANNNIGLTLESNFKAFIDQESRSANAATRHIRLIEADGHSGALASGRVLARVDFVAYGTYALAPNCAGDLQVTLHLVGKNRKSESFVATGSVDSVMALIADQVYATFAKTHFPSTVKIGSSQVTIIGGLNHGIDQTTSLKAAELSCTSRSGRLPNAEEIEMINNYGDGSGGVTLGTEDEDVYALPGGKVYVAGFHTDPVRDPSEINQRVYKYFCVR